MSAPDETPGAQVELLMAALRPFAMCAEAFDGDLDMLSNAEWLNLRSKIQDAMLAAVSVYSDVQREMHYAKVYRAEGSISALSEGGSESCRGVSVEGQG